MSLDGVRQDFVLTQRPAGTGELQVQLAVSGARVESGSARASRASAGASPEDVAVLVLTHSGRRIAYSRLRATDATGRELPARMEVQKTSDFGLRTSDFSLAVLVDDAGAVYPVRIDPTFSDANWISMGGLPGADDVVTRRWWMVQATSTSAATLHWLAISLPITSPNGTGAVGARSVRG